MAQYKSGARYLRNSTTGAVFQYRDSIAGLAGMELLEADDDGNLQKVENRPPPDVAALNPTRTPEKKEAPKTVQTVKTSTKPSTMPPVEK